MFSVVPHSCKLAHLNESVECIVDLTTSSTPQWEEPTGFTEVVSSTHSRAHNPLVPLLPAFESTSSDPARFSFSISAISSEFVSVPLTATDSTNITLDYCQCENSSESSSQTQSPSTEPSTQLPGMLSPLRNSSEFKFVEFTAIHETNVIHRLPSSSSSEDFLTPSRCAVLYEDTCTYTSKDSPSPSRKTSRSRRRCILCGGLINFADRKVANGQHWHQQCFKCATCGRFLDPGKHQEYDGLPYCKACFTSLTQTHRPVMPPQSPQEKSEIIAKIQDYNIYKHSVADHIKHKEVGDDSLVYEGVIKLYWGLKRYITLSSSDYRRQRSARESLYNYVSIDDDGFSRMFENAQRNSDGLSKDDLMALHVSETSIEEDSELVTQSLNEAALIGTSNKTAGGDDYVLQTQSDGEDDSDEENDYVNVMPLKQSVVMRQKSDVRSNRSYNQIGARRRSASFKKVQRQRRQAEAKEQKRSRFIPPYGKPTNLRVSSIQGSDEVITMLLQKYNVENPPSQFALFVMHDSGAIEVLQSCDSPLAVRLKLGPSEDVAKIFVMESSDSQKVVSQETAEYIKFQIPELNLFLKKYREEEEREIEKLKKKFELWKSLITEQLQSLHVYDS